MEQVQVASSQSEPSMAHKICVLMMSIYLLADIASGFTVIQLGVDLKISLLFKLPLTILIFTLVFVLNPNYFTVLCSVLGFLLIGPVLQLLSKADLAFFIADFSLVYKMLLPMSIFVYFGLLAMHWRAFTVKWLERILLSNFLILSINLLIGALGFGRASYSLRDGETAGSNGYIYAANELGATMIVLFSFVLHWFWNYQRKWYFIFSLVTLFFGFLVATKTAMLSALLLIFLIPLANEREKVFKFTKLKAYILVPLCIVATIIMLLIADLLKAIGLYDKFLWVLTEKGVLGVILSGRDMYAYDLWVVYIEYLDTWQQFIGVGSAGIAQFLPIKYSAEIDVVDTLVWFGFFGLLVCLAFYLFTFTKSLKQFVDSKSKYSPCVVVGSFILLFLAQLSGHVWMSGTLGIALGCFLSLLWVDREPKELA
ncbi:hypothetical protein HG263_14745 [Pseudoalteromonas sp. JBTF-M23]|uniref:O-antigen ligase-like membrane protein n=1 Tax=Pseudoalteromonas caenipelagi TaxID=2726988 RepID=A0A849VH28_9GAMM|nr:O-antigen ligase family protein [Pseudoalteromonas caenipelagi]NOU51793.1 hypothetical protein [Pseudoalteromonas caenipelagi]